MGDPGKPDPRGRDGPGRGSRGLSATLRTAATDTLTGAELASIRSLLDAAFGDDEEDRFTDEDWGHALGGVHVLVEDPIEGLLAHASLVERTLRIGDRAVRTGYVEAVATRPDRQDRGLGTRLMEAVTALVRDGYELGALGTGRHAFYERLGWKTWAGPAFVQDRDGVRRTAEDEGFILVFRTPSSPPFDGTEPLTCDWRPGDAW